MPVFYGRLQKFKHTKDPKWLTINKWTKMDVISWCGEIKRIDATHLTRYSICLCLFIVQRIWLKIWFLPFSLHSVLTGRLGAHDLSCALHSHPTITHCWLGIKLYTSNFMGRRVRTAQTANMTVVRRLYWWRVCAFFISLLIACLWFHYSSLSLCGSTVSMYCSSRKLPYCHTLSLQTSNHTLCFVILLLPVIVVDSHKWCDNNNEISRRTHYFTVLFGATAMAM